MNIAMPTITLGWILAIVGLILAVVFWAVGQLEPIPAGLFVIAFVSRLF